MVNIHPQYITDNTGNKLSVVLAMQEFEKIMEELEELDDIRLYDEAHSDDEPSIPIDEAFKIIEANRQKGK
jgi:hypothetical protein